MHQVDHQDRVVVRVVLLEAVKLSFSQLTNLVVVVQDGLQDIGELCEVRLEILSALHLSECLFCF